MDVKVTYFYNLLSFLHYRLQVHTEKEENVTVTRFKGKTCVMCTASIIIDKAENNETVTKKRFTIKNKSSCGSNAGF